jgi:LysR family glycine cleavage system transcriptional activator
MSFTGAAGELGVTQAAVSQQVKQLEDWLGTPLFNRKPRGIGLTEAGLGYLPIVRQAFDHLAAGTRDLFGDGREGPVTVRVTMSLTHSWLLPRLPRFFARHGEIGLRLMTSVDIADPGAGGIDLEIRYGSGGWPEVRAERLFEERLFPVCSPGLLAGGAALETPRDLTHRAMIHVVGEPENWQLWLREAGVSGMSVGGGLQFDLHMNAALAAMEGMGVALGLSPIVGDALADGRLVAPFDTHIPARDAHFLITPADVAERPDVAAFRDWLLAEARDSAARWADAGCA